MGVIYGIYWDSGKENGNERDCKDYIQVSFLTLASSVDIPRAANSDLSP